jgi:hypothetical protein
LLARSLPAPRLPAARITEDFRPAGKNGQAAWAKARPVYVECETKSYQARPDISTEVRALWSDRYLYLCYTCPFTQLTEFRPPYSDKKRIGLWDRDVVEAFIGAPPDKQNVYKEFQVAPTGEKLDLSLELPQRDFAWNSGFEAAVAVDEPAKVWRAEWRIPLAAVSAVPPKSGTVWRINLFRCDYAHQAFLAWNPTLSDTFHTPEKFGGLEFIDP